MISISQPAMGIDMAFKFLDAAGQIDEAKASVAIARKADELARWRGVDIEACTTEANAWVRRLAEDERKAFIEAKRTEYRQDIDLYRLASELVIDDIVEPDTLRDELIARFALAESKAVDLPERKHGVYPV